jgi:hypothetical protein
MTAETTVKVVPVGTVDAAPQILSAVTEELRMQNPGSVEPILCAAEVVTVQVPAEHVMELMVAGLASAAKVAADDSTRNAAKKTTWFFMVIVYL